MSITSNWRNKKKKIREPFQAWEVSWDEKGAEGALDAQLSNGIFSTLIFLPNVLLLFQLIEQMS